MQLIDTHVHINFNVFNSDLEAIRQRWQAAGVVHLVHSCVEPEEFSEIKAIADRFEEVSYAVGLHPLDANKWTDETAAQIEEFAGSDPRIVAIGEMGLDYYKADNQEQQKLAFKQQLTIAKKLNKPAIIHCREAAVPMAEILYDFQENQGSIGGVMHCWGGTPEETKMFLDLGFYISFSGIVTFKNAKQIQESAKIVDGDRLLVETDCPFLAPVPKRGQRNEPAYVKYVAEKVAELRGVTVESLAAQTSKNACTLFGISLSS